MISKIFCEYLLSPLGLIKIIGNNNFIIGVKFVPKENQRTKANKITSKCRRQFKEYFSGNRKRFDLPLLLEGSAFEKKVWRALQKINYGRTCTYKDIAQLIGQPRASRAVGNANGKNKIAIIVPCHRVIAQNNIGGYAAGINRKKWLLNHESEK